MRNAISILSLAMLMAFPFPIFAYTDYSRTPSDFTNTADPTTFTFTFEINPESAWNYHRFWISDSSEEFFTLSSCISSTGFEIISDTIDAPIAQYVAVGVNEYSDPTCDTFENQISNVEYNDGLTIFEVIAPESIATSTISLTMDVANYYAHAFYIFIATFLLMWIVFGPRGV